MENYLTETDYQEIFGDLEFKEIKLCDICPNETDNYNKFDCCNKIVCDTCFSIFKSESLTALPLCQEGTLGSSALPLCQEGTLGSSALPLCQECEFEHSDTISKKIKSLKKIGEGGYGVVYSSGKSIYKEVKIMITNPAFGVCPERASGSLQNEIDQRNMKELIILSSFNQPFIPKIKKIHVDKYSAKIYMKQNNCGDTLHSFVEEYVSNYSTSKKLKFLSNFLCQMSCILQWLKLQGIAHMDIKPVNICIKKGNISLIDFGLASPVCENSPYYHGTMNYSDPSYLDSTKQVSFEYDMFAVGLICFYILNSKETKWKGWKDITQEELLKRVKFNEHKNKFSVGELDTLFSLINLDEKKRPTPEELYSSTLISDRYRNKYRLPTKSESLFYLKPKNNISIELNIYINKITNSKGKYLYSYSKMIMETLLAHSLPIVSNKELKYYCLGSIYIADMLLEGIIDLSEHISTEKLVRCVMDILIALNFKVFPDVSIYSPKA